MSVLSGRPFPIAIQITDPGADMRIPLLRVPTGHTYTVERCDIVPDTTAAASTANYWEAALENAGVSGTAQAVISGTAGGTAGWVLNTPQNVTITAGSGDLTEGQYLNLKYNEEGTIAPGRFTVFLEVVDGIGSKA